MRITIIGANGFVGSAFVRLLGGVIGVELVQVTRDTFHSLSGRGSDVVINAACNSRKFVADEDPEAEFDASVTHCLKVLRHYPADLHVHISSVDVYSKLSSPHTTREDSHIDPASVSRYGAHKFLAEQLVKFYAPRWLILRAGGMVGPGLKKNPVFDILNGLPPRIHPSSEYQYISTDDMASIAWNLVKRGFRQEIFNVCGTGLMSMREIADAAGKTAPNEHPPLQTRVVHVNNDKLCAIMPVPETRTVISEFLSFL